MKIQQFIEKAVQGGWKPDGYSYRQVHTKHLPQGLSLDGMSTDICIHDTLLDPLFWKAIGKVEGWGKTFCNQADQLEKSETEKQRMHRFIDYLCDGLTLEEALKRATS